MFNPGYSSIFIRTETLGKMDVAFLNLRVITACVLISHFMENIF